MSKQALQAKKIIVEEIKSKIQNSMSVVFVQYEGINVAQDTKLRKDFRAKDVDYKIYKNRLIKIALDELGITGYDSKCLEGTTSVAFSKDEVSAASVLFDNIKTVKCLDAKFGILNGAVIDKQKVDELSKIPPREVLLAQLLGLLSAPMSAVARAIAEVAKKTA